MTLHLEEQEMQHTERSFSGPLLIPNTKFLKLEKDLDLEEPLKILKSFCIFDFDCRHFTFDLWESLKPVKRFGHSTNFQSLKYIENLTKKNNNFCKL